MYDLGRTVRFDAVQGVEFFLAEGSCFQVFHPILYACYLTNSTGINGGLIRIWWSEVTGLSNDCERGISGMLRENDIKCGSNVHLVLTMN